MSVITGSGWICCCRLWNWNMTLKPDVNAFIVKYRPKFIYVQNYPDLRAYRTYGESRFAQTFIPELVWELYEKTPFENLAVLK